MSTATAIKWRYGDAWEEFPIEPGEVWGLPNGSRVAVHDIFQPLPGFMMQADLLFVDPPWNLGNLKSFYTKAYRDDYPQSFSKFADTLFTRIRQINPIACYIEIGNQEVDAWEKRLGTLYPHVQRWPVLYYRKHPTNLLRGSRIGPIRYDFSGIDEARCIELVAQMEGFIIGDLCMGRGLVGLAAYRNGKPFVGTELNKRRLANLLQRIARLGGDVQRY